MNVNGSLEDRLVARVAALGDFFALSPRTIYEGQCEARVAVRKELPPNFTDIHVSLVRKRQFPHHTSYGQSVAALIVAMNESSWKIRDRLVWTTRKMIQTDETEAESESPFVFLPTRQVELVGPVQKRLARLSRHHERCVGVWNYFCMLAADPELFRGRTLVALGDRVEKCSPEEFNYAPALTVQSEMTALLRRVHIAAKPVSVQFYLATPR
ncbi:MAG: hypothetical protein KBD50_00935 [Candidatus Pacebacteria bacterium]|nr:hypothetical protein [Candidatus Paceibacterota bacterium]